MKTNSIICAFVNTVVCILYLCATVGFDVHHDNHDHHFYVVSLLTGISCEDIHPDDLCDCCHNLCKCHNHDHDCQHKDCTDEIHQITITGTEFHIDFDLSPLTVDIPMPKPLCGCTLPRTGFFYDCSGSVPPDDILNKICILRV